MAATWTWDRHHETWTPPDSANGSTSVYNKPFLGGVSLQRVLVRFTPYGALGTEVLPGVHQPADAIITVTLGLGSEFGAVEILAYVQLAPQLNYRRNSDTDPSLWQQYEARYPAVEWDIAARHKNVSAGGQQALVSLTIEYQPLGAVFPSQVVTLPTFGGLQFDALFSQ